jgi:hypothetical protein
MKMDYIGLQLFEDAKEIPRGIWQVPAHVCLYGEARCSHLLTKRAKSRNGIDAGIMALFPLQTAQLRHQCLSSANFHAIYHMSNNHTDCVNLR